MKKKAEKGKSSKKDESPEEDGKVNASPKKGKANKKDESPEKDGKVNAPATLASFDDFVSGLCSWKDALKDSWSEKYFKDLYEFLKKEYSNENIYPPHDMIFNAFKATPMSKIKVVIIGQDPYFQHGQAMGMSFSVPKGVKTPSSLGNIYKSLENDPKIKDFKRPEHGDLTKWANQGVFLLNAVLTVKEGKPNSHKKAGWSKFTDAVIDCINKDCDKVVFLLWGADAQKKGAPVDRKKHCVLETTHPSGQSSSKGFNTACHFSKCNEYLKENGLPEIDWSLN